MSRKSRREAPPASPPAWEKWMTPREAAEYLGISLGQVGQLARDGRLNRFSAARTSWILQDDVESYARLRADRVDSRVARARWCKLRRSQQLAPGAEDPTPPASSLIGRPSSLPEWIPALEAADILGLSRSALHWMARRGAIQRRMVDRNSYFDAVELVAIAQERRRHREEHPRPGEGFQWWGNRAVRPRLRLHEHLITSADAAAILKITPLAVTNLVRRGLLPAHQKRPGKQGSPLLLVDTQVHSLARQDRYRRSRARYEKRFDGEPYRNQGWESHDIPPPEDRVPHPVDHGIYYTTAQAAEVLGVTRTRVTRLRKEGRLKGYQNPARRDRQNLYRSEPRTGNRWWFYKKMDVHDLQADPAYCDRRARWLKGRQPKEPAFPTIEELDACIRINAFRRPPDGEWRESGWDWGPIERAAFNRPIARDPADL